MTEDEADKIVETMFDQITGTAGKDEKTHDRTLLDEALKGDEMFAACERMGHHSQEVRQAERSSPQMPRSADQPLLVARAARHGGGGGKGVASIRRAAPDASRQPAICFVAQQLGYGGP